MRGYFHAGQTLVYLLQSVGGALPPRYSCCPQGYGRIGPLDIVELPGLWRCDVDFSLSNIFDLGLALYCYGLTMILQMAASNTIQMAAVICWAVMSFWAYPLWVTPLSLLAGFWLVILAHRHHCAGLMLGARYGFRVISLCRSDASGLP